MRPPTSSGPPSNHMVNKPKANVRALLTRLFICLCFGALFFAIEEVCQSKFIERDHGCCERCSNYLYDRAQPVLALCATLACFLYIWKCPASVSCKRSLRFAIILSATSFLGYFVFIGTNIYLRTECTALYSPGPGFLHSVAIWGTAGRVRCAHRICILVLNLYALALNAGSRYQSVSTGGADRFLVDKPHPVEAGRNIY